MVNNPGSCKDIQLYLWEGGLAQRKKDRDNETVGFHSHNHLVGTIAASNSKSTGLWKVGEEEGMIERESHGERASLIVYSIIHSPFLKNKLATLRRVNLSL